MRNTYKLKVSYDEAVLLAKRVGGGLYEALRKVYKPMSLRYYRRFRSSRLSLFVLTIPR